MVNIQGGGGRGRKRDKKKQINGERERERERERDLLSLAWTNTLTYYRICTLKSVVFLL
jgi:hypothetical protein